MNYQRSQPFLVALILWLLSQAFWFTPRFFYVAVALGLALIVFSLRDMAKRNKKDNWFFYLSAPILFWLSFSLFAAIVTSSWWVQLVFIVEAWLIYSYSKNLYYHFAYAAPERVEKIDSLLWSGGFLSAFALGSALYGLSAFISWPFVFLLLSFIPFAALLFFQFLPFKKINWSKEWILLLIIVGLFIELAGVLSFLPLNFLILGLLLALIYYFLLTTWHLAASEELNRHKVKLPLLFSLIIVILLLLSSRWL